MITPYTNTLPAGCLFLYTVVIWFSSFFGVYCSKVFYRDYHFLMQRFITLSAIVVMVVVMPFVVSYAAPDIGLGQLQGTELSDRDPKDIIAEVTKFVAGLIAVLSVLMIIVGGIMYIVSAGDSSKADKAKGIIVSAIVGLVIAILAYAIVIYVGRAMGLFW